MLTGETGEGNVVVPAAADRAAGQETGRQLRVAEGAESSHLGQRDAAEVRPINSEDCSGRGLDLEHVIVPTPIFVRLADRTPARGESEATIAAREIAYVRHRRSMARAPLKVTRLGAAIAVVALLVSCTDQPAPQSAAPSTTAQPSTRPSPTNSPDDDKSGPRDNVFGVWMPGGVPQGMARRLASPNVRVTKVTAGLSWMRSASDGRSPPRGWEFPFEMAYISPSHYARFIQGADATRKLEQGDMVLAETASRMRDDGRGLRLDLDTGHFVVRDVVSDEATSGYEALAAGRPPAGWGRAYLLVRSQNAYRLVQEVRRLASGHPFRVRRGGIVPFLRYADGVTPQMYYKQEFGEFPAVPSADGSIEIEPAWRHRNIVHAKVPILGEVTCHRRFVTQLRNAMRRVVRAKLQRLVHPSQFAGCFNARFIGSDPSDRLSAHAWGGAVDLNASENPFGAKPAMDRRLVRLLRRFGFNWGGDWLVPDGMHFEWARTPYRPGRRS
ncbi:MAG: hypothetical protein QOH90_949 [Actinomycetota bacterium]|nr:hypothetical protein [Actinomycetota bacterium]